MSRGQLELRRAALGSGKPEGAAHLLGRAPAVGDFVLFLVGHLCVGALAGVAVGDEDGVVAEAGGTARFCGQGAVDGSLEDADSVGGGVAERSADGGAAVGMGTDQPAAASKRVSLC